MKEIFKRLRIPEPSIFILYFSFISQNASAQATFGKSYFLPDSTFTSAPKVIQTSDGGYLLIGVNYYSNIFSKALIIKTTATGDTVWTAFLEDSITSTRTFPQCGVELPGSQGYLISGYSITSAGTYRAFAFTLDTAGNFTWAKEYLPTVNTATFIYNCTLSLDGNILLSGLTVGPSSLTSGYLLVKISATGNVIWTRVVLNTHNNTISNNNRIVQLPDSSIIICGTTMAYIVNDLQYIRNFIAKFSLNGTLVWAKTYGDSLTITEANALSFGNGNQLLISGRHSIISTGQPPSIGYLLSLDTAGNIQWYREYGNFTNYIAGIYQAKILTTGDILVLKPKNTAIGLQLSEVNSMGLPIWSKILVPQNAWSLNINVSDFSETFDGGIVLAGGIVLPGLYNTAFFKTDSTGTFNCAAIDTLVNSTLQTISHQNVNLNILVAILNDSAKTYFRSSGIMQNDICMGTGISEGNNIFNTAIYPNPTNNLINFYLPHKQTVNIFNSLGEIVFHKIIKSEGLTQIDVSFLPSGIYIVRADNIVGRFIKE